MTTDFIGAIAQGGAAIADAAENAPSSPVESCPGWTTSDLLVHVGRLHAWVADILRRPVLPDAPSPARPEEPALSGAALVAWARSNTGALLDALSTTDLDAGRWTFGQPKNGKFWLRRMAHETNVHGLDAARAVGKSWEIAPELAADGIDEFVSLTLARRVQSTGDAWHGESIHLHQTDGPNEWLVVLGPDGLLEVERVHAKGDVALRGTAADLYLWCLGRASASTLETFGDGSIIERWSELIHF